MAARTRTPLAAPSHPVSTARTAASLTNPQLDEHFVHGAGGGFDGAQAGLELLLVVGGVADVLADDEAALDHDGGLRVVALLKAAAAHGHDAAFRVGEVVLLLRRGRLGGRLRFFAARLFSLRPRGVARGEFALVFGALDLRTGVGAVRAAERADRVGIGMGVRAEQAHRHAVVRAALDLAAGKHARRVALRQAQDLRL